MIQESVCDCCGNRFKYEAPQMSPDPDYCGSLCAKTDGGEEKLRVTKFRRSP